MKTRFSDHIQVAYPLDTIPWVLNPGRNLSSEAMVISFKILKNRNPESKGEFNLSNMIHDSFLLEVKERK